VLHLQARVGLDEDEGQAGGGGIDQELEGAQALVAHRARHRSAASMSAGAAPRQAGLGAISTSFWKRRCSVQSRSPSAIASCPSPSTCTSIWRAPSIRRSTYTPSTPKAARLAAAALVGGGQLAGRAHRAHAAPAATADGLEHHAGAALGGQEGLRPA
jgi:hypothetical protein